MADVKEAEKLFLDGEFEKSFGLLSELVKDESNGRALYLMGLFYLDGIYVQKSDDTSRAYMEKAMASGDILAEMCVLESRGDGADREAYRKWMKKMRSAKLDKDPFGMYQIGYCYQWGLGVKKDWAKALPWYEKAAAAGFVTAACAAGCVCKDGGPKVENTQKAFRYFSRAAEKGFCFAEGQLAECFFLGIGTGRDLEKAIAYTERAANHGDRDACDAAGIFYFFGELTGKDDKKAFHYFEKGAELGNPKSYYFLGRCYLKGRGRDMDYAKSLECYKKAWEGGCREAAAAVGDLYLKLPSSSENSANAFCWFQKAIEVGEFSGLVGMGRCYKEGIGTEPDKEKAKRCLMRADEKGYLDGTFLLGEMAFEEKDYQEALRLYQKAAYDKHIPAMNRLAMCYAKGIGVPRNLLMAKAYLKESDAEGDPDAKRLMEEYLVGEVSD